MAVKVRRLSYTLGAEIEDIDIKKPVSQAVVQEIRQAWLENHVLLFRGQDVTPEQHIAFSRNFGELEIHPMSRYRLNSDYPEIFDVTNRATNGKPSESAYIGDGWHTDGAFTTQPPAGSLLLCREKPDIGGDTWFTNLHYAYDTLSDTMKRVVGTLETVQDARMEQEKRHPEKAARDHGDVPPVIQPLVRIHPETGRKALYANPLLTRRIHGMSADESAGLLDFLFKHATRPEFTYRHQWKVHDLIMWDNRSTLHFVPHDYDRSQIRHMCRTTLVGTPSGRLYEPQYVDKSVQ